VTDRSLSITWTFPSTDVAARRLVLARLASESPAPGPLPLASTYDERQGYGPAQDLCKTEAQSRYFPTALKQR